MTRQSLGFGWIVQGKTAKPYAMPSLDQPVP
jgi:hypothetical protein